MHKKLSVALILLSSLFFSCTNKLYLKKIIAYLNAPTVEAKSKYMAENYRSYFLEKKDSGQDKKSALQSFQNWDGQLNPDIKISQYRVHNKDWLITFNEQNDFSKLIGFPGWKGSMDISFDDAGLIVQTIYIPDSTNPAYKPFLQPAIDWLQKNMPTELNTVYQDHKLVRNEMTAKEWKILLQAWREKDKK
jgi:hypothetical protein